MDAGMMTRRAVRNQGSRSIAPISARPTPRFCFSGSTKTEYRQLSAGSSRYGRPMAAQPMTVPSSSQAT